VSAVTEMSQRTRSELVAELAADLVSVEEAALIMGVSASLLYSRLRGLQPGEGLRPFGAASVFPKTTLAGRVKFSTAELVAARDAA
jgi:transposase-like protein